MLYYRRGTYIIPAPSLWRGILIVEVEKNTDNERGNVLSAFEIIATEVRTPGKQTIVVFK